MPAAATVSASVWWPTSATQTAQNLGAVLVVVRVGRGRGVEMRAARVHLSRDPGQVFARSISRALRRRGAGLPTGYGQRRRLGVSSQLTADLVALCGELVQSGGEHLQAKTGRLSHGRILTVT
jgi:hypothetical protein